MADTDGILFNLDEYKLEGKPRKKPQTEAEKRLEEIQEMQDRDFWNLRNKLNRGEVLTAAEGKRLDEYRKRYQEQSGAALPPGTVATQKEVAQYFGVHIQTIKNWCAAGCPRNPDSYTLSEIQAWAIGKGLVKSSTPGENANSSVDGFEEGDRAYWDRENAKAQAKTRQLKNQILEGKIVYSDDVYKNFFEASRMARDAILNIGPALATSLARNDMERREILDRYRKEISALLHELEAKFNAKRSGYNL